jgi:hypothetical protein
MASAKPGFSPAAAAGDQAVRLKVTGVDSTGHMFRHSAEVLMLDGRNCEFRSESQPEQDGSLLAEFDYPQADPQRRITQARVKSSQADGDAGFYRVVVELDLTQSVVVAAPQAEPASMIKKPGTPPVPVVAAVLAPAPRSPESKPVARVASPEPAALPRSFSVPPPSPFRSSIEERPVPKRENREALPKTAPEDSVAVRETVKSSVAAEVKREMEALQKRILGEMERSLASIVSSNMEQMIREGVGKLFASNYNASLQALKTDVTPKIVEGLTASTEVRAAIENLAKRQFEVQSGLARTAGAQAERALGSRVDEIVASLEKSLAELEVKTGSARGEMEATLAKSQGVLREIDAAAGPLREAMQRVNDAESSGIGSFQDQAAAQMSSFAEQFENMLGKAFTEKAAQFSAELERQIAPLQKQSDEMMDKLAAGFQLLRTTARVQQEHLTEHSRATAANFEKEIRQALLRFAGGAEIAKRSDEKL